MSQKDKIELMAHKCSNCNRILFKGNFVGEIEIKCARCKQLIKFKQIEITPKKNDN